jgi:hypothetical protein
VFLLLFFILLSLDNTNRDIGRYLMTFNLENFRLPEGISFPSPKKQRPDRLKRGRQFVKGPIPIDWLSKAASLHGKVFQTAIALWYLVGAKKTITVSLSNEIAEKFGVGRNAKYKNLEVLKQAGLVTVQRKHGRSPVVTLLCAEQISFDPIREGQPS